MAPPVGLLEAGWRALPEGRALDVACGRGGVTVWAAASGMDVVAVDVSPVAIDATLRLAADHGVTARVDGLVHDLDTGLPATITGLFDLVVCQRFRDPTLWPALIEVLAPGGVLVVTVLSRVGAVRPGRFHAPSGSLAEELSVLDVDLLASWEAGGLATVVAARAPVVPVDRVGAMDDKLRSVLDELQSTIVRAEADGVIDDTERRELRELTGKLDALLAEQSDDSLVEQLEEAAIRFEGRHPTLASAIQSAVHTLTGYGI